LLSDVSSDSATSSGVPVGGSSGAILGSRRPMSFARSPGLH
jgi:hypothetical protein